jgi:hypothetical protein
MPSDSCRHVNLPSAIAPIEDAGAAHGAPSSAGALDRRMDGRDRRLLALARRPRDRSDH